MTSFTIINASQLQLVFSERIKNPAALQAKNYALTPSIDIQLISAQRDTVKLYLAEKLISGTNYQISVRNLRDVFGNIMESTSLTREYLEISPAGPGDVVINEILYQRAGATAPEFVELYNRSSENFNLANWQLGDGTDLIDIGQLIQLKAGQYILLTGNEKLASTKANGHYLPGFPSLNDNEEAVYIRSDRQVTIDSLYYYSRWGGSDGISIERKDPLAASNDASNWTTSESQDGASAGNINGSYSPDESPPGILFSSRKTDGLIEVRFTEFIQISESLVFTLDGSALPVEQFVPSRGNRIWLNTPSGKQKKGKSATISIQNLTDVKGNITPSASIPIAESVTPGSVVINEIMYNPLSESEDNQPDQSEYIELRNTRDYAISLEGFSLHDAPDENDEIQTLVPVSSTSTYLPANGHLLIHADEALDFSESQTAEFFELSGLDPNRTVRIDRGTLSLASQNDAIYLADSTGATIDSVYYDESWQNPNIVDTRGVALERINPNGPSSDASNWSSSTTDKGGTPGSENSIYQIPGTQPEEIGISFTPNPFSPDDDGYEDHLFINYTLDQPDYLLKVRIFDRYGRLVRELVDGEQAGYEGSLQWDGLTDSGNRNRIGIFVVLFEAYDSSNGSDRTFKEVVVLARQL
ncbi:MAG: lamin tail domain-containing protein [Balneolaceae bacterium]|nr:lamin tail domain-containing protein [Balneolaceae bacterium]